MDKDREQALELIVAGDMMVDAADEAHQSRAVTFWLKTKKSYMEKYDFTEAEFTRKHVELWNKAVGDKESLHPGDEYD